MVSNVGFVSETGKMVGPVGLEPGTKGFTVVIVI
jgi:hypothetical protein